MDNNTTTTNECKSITKFFIKTGHIFFNSTTAFTEFVVDLNFVEIYKTTTLIHKTVMEEKGKIKTK